MRPLASLLAVALIGWSAHAEEPPKPEPALATVVPVGAKEGSVLMIEPRSVPGDPAIQGIMPGPTAIDDKPLMEVIKTKVWDNVWEATGGNYLWINPGGVGGFGMFALEPLRDWDQ